MVFSSSVRGEVSTHRYLCHDGLTVSGTCLRRIRDVDMKRDFAFVVRISSSFYLSFSLAHEHMPTCTHTHKVYTHKTMHLCFFLFLFFWGQFMCHANMILSFVFFFLALNNRNLVTRAMLTMQDIA